MAHHQSQRRRWLNPNPSIPSSRPRPSPNHNRSQSLNRNQRGRTSKPNTLRSPTRSLTQSLTRSPTRSLNREPKSSATEDHKVAIEPPPPPAAEKSEPHLEPKAKPKEKLAVPDAAAQEKVSATIRSVYADEYKSDKAALPKKLLQTAKDTQDSTERFVLLRTAKKIACDTDQTEIAFAAIDAMASEYDVSALEMKAEVIERGATLARTHEEKRALAELALKLIDDAVDEDNFEIAKSLSQQASQLARSSSDKDFLQTVVAKNKELESTAKAHSEAEEAIATLKNKPTDPDANTTVGKYLCFAKGEWEKGLSMLCEGSDPKLKALAETDKNGATAASKQVQLGDGWWDAGGKQRAIYWYEKALPELAGLEKAKVEKRLGETTRNQQPGGLTSKPRPEADTLAAEPNTAAKNGREVTSPGLSAAQTTAILKRKLHGRVTFTPKTNEITLAYDFHNKNQLQDFDLKGNQPALINGMLGLAAGQSIRHVVNFQTVTIAGVLSNKGKGEYLTSTGGLRIHRDGDWIEIENGVDGTREHCAGKQHINRFVVEITEKAMRFALGQGVVGKETKSPPVGQVDLCGGESGAGFSMLTIKGVVDQDWLESFLHPETHKESGERVVRTPHTGKAKPTQFLFANESDIEKYWTLPDKWQIINNVLVFRPGATLKSKFKVEGDCEVVIAVDEVGPNFHGFITLFQVEYEYQKKGPHKILIGAKARSYLSWIMSKELRLQ